MKEHLQRWHAQYTTLQKYFSHPRDWLFTVLRNPTYESETGTANRWGD